MKTKLCSGYDHRTGLAQVAVYPDHGTTPIVVHDMTPAELLKIIERLELVLQMATEIHATQQEEK